MIPRIGSKLIARGQPLVSLPYEILNIRQIYWVRVVHTHKRKLVRVCVFAHAH